MTGKHWKCNSCVLKSGIDTDKCTDTKKLMLSLTQFPMFYILSQIFSVKFSVNIVVWKRGKRSARFLYALNTQERESLSSQWLAPFDYLPTSIMPHIHNRKVTLAELNPGAFNLPGVACLSWFKHNLRPLVQTKHPDHFQAISGLDHLWCKSHPQYIKIHDTLQISGSSSDIKD